jgi:hypothetical protein
VKPCPACGNKLANVAVHCNGCGWDHIPCDPPMGFDALRAIARAGIWPARVSPYADDIRERDEERAAIQEESADER